MRLAVLGHTPIQNSRKLCPVSHGVRGKLGHHRNPRRQWHTTSGNADLAYPVRPGRGVRVWPVKPVGFDCRNVGVRRDEVIGQALFTT